MKPTVLWDLEKDSSNEMALFSDARLVVPHRRIANTGNPSGEWVLTKGQTRKLYLAMKKMYEATS